MDLLNAILYLGFGFLLASVCVWFDVNLALTISRLLSRRSAALRASRLEYKRVWDTGKSPDSATGVADTPDPVTRQMIGRTVR